ncbi:MAG: transposase [Sedimenticolaceae bacterium]
MVLPPKSLHPLGERNVAEKRPISTAMEVETFAGKVHVEWDPTAAVTPIGQLPFFIEFLKLGHRFTPWVEDCPLHYASNNAPQKIDVLGSLFLSILSGHKRYAHMTALRGDNVNTKLLGMSKVISDDSAVRALKRMDETAAIEWLQRHLQSCYEPLLSTPWILDVDVTVKPLYGHQEGAEVGYNPHKPGRPSHTYHSYLMANTRLVLDVDVLPGDESHACHSMPGLISLLKRLPDDGQPEFIRGDCEWGTDPVMSELEAMDRRYLFKLKRSKRVKALIAQLHGLGAWTRFNPEWELKESTLQLQGWKSARRVIVARRRLPKDPLIGLEYQRGGQRELALVEGPEDMRLFEYSVLVTNLNDALVTLMRHYRDRADCENNFDETKNQWGWGGFVTRQLQTSQIMARMVALIYNWWNLFVRLAIPDKHHEAITSRPLLLSSVGRLTESGRQRRMVITSTHGQTTTIQRAYARVHTFFSWLKVTAPQLTQSECWRLIATKSMEVFMGYDPPGELPQTP